MAHTGSYAMTIRSQSLGSLTLATTVNSPVVSATDTQHFVLLRWYLAMMMMMMMMMTATYTCSTDILQSVFNVNVLAYIMAVGPPF